MKHQFEKNQDIKIFANYITGKLEASKHYDLANEVKTFENIFYTTSSEYLGEFRIILNKIISIETNLDKEDIIQIKRLIKEIDAAFSPNNRT